MKIQTIIFFEMGDGREVSVPGWGKWILNVIDDNFLQSINDVTKIVFVVNIMPLAITLL